LFLALFLAGCQTSDARSNPSNDASAADESPLDAMQIIEERTSDLRELDIREPITKALLTTDELRQLIVDDWFEEYSEQDVRDDVLLYVAFEFAEPDLDLYNMLVDLYTEQVIGFYDPETDEMYLIKSGEELGAMERSTYSHEIVHALQDQHFDVDEMTDASEDFDSERVFAWRSLMEGDASLLQQQYMLQYFEPSDLRELVDQANEVDMTALDAVPSIVRETVTFPYDAGLRFVMALFAQGGWAAVDAAYENPPLSTEQIVHPDRYPDDVPQVVALPPLTDTLGAGWRIVDEDVLGEFALQLYLGNRIGSEDTERAAEGWGGDRYAVHWREDESAFVLVLRLAWDTVADADEFFNAYVQFAEDRFGSASSSSDAGARNWWFGDDALLLARNGPDETLVVIAPDEETLNAVHALFPEF
jgi:hypothetical protein